MYQMTSDSSIFCKFFFTYSGLHPSNLYFVRVLYTVVHRIILEIHSAIKTPSEYAAFLKYVF